MPPKRRKQDTPIKEVVSLDDAAALLLAADPADAAQLARARDTFFAVADRADLDAGIRECAEQTGYTLARLAAGTSPHPEADLAHAVALIESVMSPAPAAVTAPVESAVAPSLTLPADTDLELLTDFIAESREYVAGAESALLRLETDASDQEAINVIFRAFHTIKGTSAFLGLGSLSDVAHHAESLLSRVRDREITCTGGYADLALRSVDLMKELLDAVESARDGAPLAVPDRYADVLRCLKDPEGVGIGEGSAAGPHEAPDPEARSSAPPPPPPPARTTAPAPQDPAETSVRLRTDRLDRLVDLVGEIVIAQAMLSQDPTVVGGIHPELGQKVAHAGKIVRELQDLSMSMRMVPLKPTFQKLARLVRDVSQKTGKRVDFVMEGEETEIDRNMVDVIADPLVHMVRNAIDHGLEPPDERDAAGKSRAGTVRIAAYHAGGNVVVELADDGRGLDRDRILHKAVERGLVDHSATLSDSEIYNLIFAPGFSTAEVVTDLSGRGVGMDVVRQSVEALRGRIDISSAPGRGSTFTVRLPLTLAITDSMLVRAGAERYIVPTVNIDMSFRPTREMLFTVAGRGEMVMLRDTLLPIVRLHRLFDVPGAREDATSALLVVIGAGERRCALLVDELLGQQQVVAKTLGAAIGKIPGLAGGAILGDGRVGLILDAAEIIALSRTATLQTPEEVAAVA